MTKSNASLDEVHAVLASYLSRMTANGMIRAAAMRVGMSEGQLAVRGVDAATLHELRRGIAVFVPEARRRECIERLERLIGDSVGAAVVPPPPVDVVIRDENGIVDARTRAKVLAATLGFRPTDQYKIATAVSEVARNIYSYVGRGEVRFGPVTSPRAGIFVIARDDGPGIPDLGLVLSEGYVSKTGLGRGLKGCKQIMDVFEVDTGPGRGTKISMRKYV